MTDDIEDDDRVSLNELYFATPTARKKNRDPLGFEGLHRQSFILGRIKKASKKSAGELEQLFCRGTWKDGNKGKTWRRWETGETECPVMENIISRAIQENWLDEQSAAVIDYMFKKRAALNIIDQRRKEFYSKRAAVKKAITLLSEFKQLIDDAYDREAKEPSFLNGFGTLTCGNGADDEEWSDIPWPRENNDAHFAELLKSLTLLTQLELHDATYLAPDPITGQIDYFNINYSLPPDALKQVCKMLKSS